jgi:hypothetical protein
MDKALGRKDFVVINVVNRLKQPPYKELLVVKDFTGKFVNSLKIR